MNVWYEMTSGVVSALVERQTWDVWYHQRCVAKKSGVDCGYAILRLRLRHAPSALSGLDNSISGNQH